MGSQAAHPCFGNKAKVQVGGEGRSSVANAPVYCATDVDVEVPQGQILNLLSVSWCHRRKHFVDVMGWRE